MAEAEDVCELSMRKGEERCLLKHLIIYVLFFAVPELVIRSLLFGNELNEAKNLPDWGCFTYYIIPSGACVFSRSYCNAIAIFCSCWSSYVVLFSVSGLTLIYCVSSACWRISFWSSTVAVISSSSPSSIVTTPGVWGGEVWYMPLEQQGTVVSSLQSGSSGSCHSPSKWFLYHKSLHMICANQLTALVLQIKWVKQDLLFLLSC